MKTMTRKSKPAKITYEDARRLAWEQRERLVADAAAYYKRTTNYHDLTVYAHPFPVVGEPVRRLDVCAGSSDVPAGCEVMQRVPFHGLTALQACRLLDDKMQSVPMFNCAEIA